MYTFFLACGIVDEFLLYFVILFSWCSSKLAGTSCEVSLSSLWDIISLKLSVLCMYICTSKIIYLCLTLYVYVYIYRRQNILWQREDIHVIKYKNSVVIIANEPAEAAAVGKYCEGGKNLERFRKMFVR